MIISAVDTLWSSFTTRMTTINPQRLLMGIMDAQDFPPQTVEPDAFYLVTKTEHPLGKNRDSAALPIYVYLVDFTWVNIGTNIGTAQNLEGKNRGDRYRTNYQMKSELIQALYPRFAEKVQAPSGTVLANQASFTLTTLNEPVWWDYPKFTVRADRNSGLLYTTAQVELKAVAEGVVT